MQQPGASNVLGLKVWKLHVSSAGGSRPKHLAPWKALLGARHGNRCESCNWLRTALGLNRCLSSGR